MCGWRGGIGRALSGLARALPRAESVKGVRLVPIEFEKDDAAHIDYVTACSNLRASNYNITHADKHNTKLIAGARFPPKPSSDPLTCRAAVLFGFFGNLASGHREPVYRHII